MGVLTTAYSVSPKLMKRIEKDNESLGLLFGQEETADEAWRVPSYGFDKGFEETIGILGACGYPVTRDALDLECAGDDDPTYDGYDVRVVKPPS